MVYKVRLYKPDKFFSRPSYSNVKSARVFCEIRILTNKQSTPHKTICCSTRMWWIVAAAVTRLSSCRKAESDRQALNIR